jgi:hypothetical protein
MKIRGPTEINVCLFQPCRLAAALNDQDWDVWPSSGDPLGDPGKHEESLGWLGINESDVPASAFLSVLCGSCL